MRARAKFWIEGSNGFALCGWLCHFLSLIDQTGSLAEAARRERISYRRAWGKIRRMEQGLGQPLLIRRAGGAGGGGARLTPEARQLIARYRRFEAGLSDLVERRFQESFHP